MPAAIDLTQLGSSARHDDENHGKAVTRIVEGLPAQTIYYLARGQFMIAGRTIKLRSRMK